MTPTRPDPRSRRRTPTSPSSRVERRTSSEITGLLTVLKGILACLRKTEAIFRPENAPGRPVPRRRRHDRDDDHSAPIDCRGGTPGLLWPPILPNGSSEARGSLRDAHEISGTCVRLAETRGSGLADLTRTLQRLGHPDQDSSVLEVDGSVRGHAERSTARPCAARQIEKRLCGDAGSGRAPQPAHGVCSPVRRSHVDAELTPCAAADTGARLQFVS